MLSVYDLACQVTNLDSNRHSLLIPALLVEFDQLSSFFL